MYKNEEKSIMSCLSKIDKGNIIELVWNKKIDIFCGIDTFYESDNGLDIDEKEYEEFYACVLKVIKIKHIEQNFVKEIKLKDKHLEENELFEINYHNAPDVIKNKNGLVIWKNPDIITKNDSYR